MSRWDGVVATSFNSAAGGLTVLSCRPRGVRPGQHHQALRELGNDHDPGEDINQPVRSNAWPVEHVSAAPAPSPNPDQLRRRGRYHRAMGEFRNVSLTTNRN